MSSIWTPFRPLALCAFFAWTLASTALVAAPAEAELAEAAKWMDTLEWPDLHGKAYVELTFGEPKEGSKPINHLRGFLMAEDDKSWSIFCDGTSSGYGRFFSANDWPFFTNSFGKAARGAPAATRISIRSLELPKAVDEVLEDLRKREEDQPARFPRFGGRTSEETALFILARCCARQDRADLAARLDQALIQRVTTQAGHPPREAFRQTLERDLSTVSMWKAVVAFGNPAVTRPQLLAQFQRIVKDFPTTPYRERAAGYVEQLERMVAEDKAHTAVTLADIETMPADRQVAEWIVRLREQNGQQITQPGTCDIFSEEYARDAPKSPAMHLVDLRFAAVPSLIEALADVRPTRSVGFHRDFHFSHYVLTVGDCAAAILSRIAGQRFWISRTLSGAMPKVGDAASTRAAAEEWWRGVQKKGEKAVLAENVRAGGKDSVEQARRLVALDPTEALAAIGSGLNFAKPWEEVGLVSALAAINSAEATLALQAALRQSTSLAARLEAARGLFRRGEKDGIPAMIQEWEKWQPVPAGQSDGGHERAESLIKFLATCDDPAAAKALAMRFAALPVDLRLEVIEGCAKTGGRVGGVRPALKEAPLEIQALQEELLITALADPSVRSGLSGSRTGAHGSVSYRNPRVCDFAAFFLMENWPDRYQFRWYGTRLERDIQLVSLGNLWRAAHGKPALTAPEIPSHEAAAREPNTVAAIRWAGGDALPGLPIAVGQPLTAESVVTLLARLRHDMPKQFSGFTLNAERPGEKRGFLVEIEWKAKPRPAKPTFWNSEVDVSLDGQSLHNSSGGSALAYLDENGDKEEQRSIAKALAGPANVPISISYSGSRLSEN